MGVGKLRFLVHYSCQAKITYLHVAIVVKEYIPWFKISMENFLWLFIVTSISLSVVNLISLLSAMTLIQSKRYLHQYFPNNVFSYVIRLFAGFSNNHSQVSALAILHDDVNS